ncbi:hypothetical protein ANO11243_079790 [Dothideomycetidae sp. 11243]|nr:hypothetical protein ANO11243_079790 [fungal sp. No.11243]
MNKEARSSSPDPISLIADSSPYKSYWRGSPLRPVDTNARSPRKTIVVDAEDADGRSPWRIKVTVEAEPAMSSPVNINRNSVRTTRSTAVPLKGGDSSPLKARTTRSRSSFGASSQQSMTQFDPSIQAGRKPTPARRGMADPARAHGTTPSSQTISTAGRRSQRSVNITTVNDFQAQQHQTNHFTASTQQSTSTGVAIHGEADFPNFADNEILAEDDMDVDMDAPGDATTFENEEFSMISVDSLSSHQPVQGKSPLPGTHDQPQLSQRQKPDTTISYMPSSPPVLRYNTITPQIMQTPREPPARPQETINHSTVANPLRASVVRSGKVLQDIVRTPDREQSASRERPTSNGLLSGFSANARRELRESLQLGMQMADSLHDPSNSVHNSHSGSTSNSLGIQYPDLRDTRIDHRLPTPEEKDHHEKSTTSVSSGPAVYPQISMALLQPSSVVSRRSYDPMAWSPIQPVPPSSAIKASGRSVLLSPMGAPSAISISSEESEDLEDDEEEEEDDEDHEVEVEVVEEEEDDEDDEELESTGRETEEQFRPASSRPSADDSSIATDIWQEEAIRSSVDDEPRQERRIFTPPSTDDEELEEHSVNSSRSRQGDVRESVKDHRLQSSVLSGRRSENDDARNHTSEASDSRISAEGDDTGLFWRANQPNELRRQDLRRQNDYSAISELRPIDTSTRLLDQSSMDSSSHVGRSTVEVRSTQSHIPASSQSTLPKKAASRRSSLKSRNIGSSPPRRHSNHTVSFAEAADLTYADTTQNFEHEPEPSFDKEDEEEDYTLHSEQSQQTEQTEQSEQTVDESTALDVRQLRGEMAAQVRQTQAAIQSHDSVLSAEPESSQEEVSWFESTDLQTSRSYVENLNLSSPVKIAVKFDDSSAVPPVIEEHEDVRSDINTSILVPERKKYASLFEDDAPLGAVDVSDSTIDASSVSRNKDRSSPPQEQSGLLSQTTNSFWARVTPKSAPAPQPLPKVFPAAVDAPSGTAQASPELQSTVVDSTSMLDITTISDETLRLRRKYGLLSPSQPFTLAHAQTLRRLYLSCAQHPESTLVPLSAPLPYEVAHYRAHYGKTQVHVAAAFMSLLVPGAEREKLEAQGGWGDATAAKFRGWDSRGRHGSWFAFAGEGQNEKEARALRGEIELPWVLEVLHEIVVKTEAMARR